jgi:hypothetical protein
MKRIQKGKHITRSSSSGRTALSKKLKAVLDLGRALVEELGLDPSADTLSCWMAHYIAELIVEAEAANIEERPAKSANCANAILGLWGHRHQLPNGKRPFEDLEPILRALESLDPTEDTPRYLRSPRVAVDETEQNEETRKWLELADRLDYSARILIRYCLTQAAQTALDSSEDWVALAKKAGMQEGIDLTVTRILTDESVLLKVREPEDRTRKVLEDRVNRLESFGKMAGDFATALRKQLEQAPDSKEDAGKP